MKIRMLLLLLWSSGAAFAQTPPDSTATYKEVADYVFAPLTQSGIPSGILIDRVYPASGIAWWTQPVVTGDTANGTRMLQALYEIEEARLVPDPAAPHLVRRTVLTHTLCSRVYTLSVSDGLATYGKHVQVVH